MFPTLRQFDTLSDRKELYSLLARLDRGCSTLEGLRRRNAVLMDMAREIGLGAEHHVLGAGAAGETYALVVGLCAQFGLDIEKVALWLERRVRRGGG